MKTIIVFIGYVICIFCGSIFVSLICKTIGFEQAKISGVSRAGTIIGMFERFVILTFVLLNQYSAIAFIFTAKSIARFEELKNREFSEYYLVGTLSSVSFAIFCGEIMKFLLKKI